MDTNREDIQELKKVIIDVLSKSKNKGAVERIGVFGSIARGDYNDKSDIDVAWEYKHLDNEKDLHDYCVLSLNIEDTLRKNFNRKVDLIDYQAFYEINQSISDIEFKEEIDKELVWIYG